MTRLALLAAALAVALAGGAVAAENRQVKIRLHGIDAPEAKQAFGTVARKALADLIADKVVSVEEVDRDRYGRVVANVRVAGKLVNTEMVRSGLAWRYIQYDKQNEFGAIEDDARRHRRGLWADAHPVAPWEWRKTERDRKAVEAGR